MTDKYWVGGAGTWNTSNTANWSLTSGGVSGAAVPATGDRVFLDANSGTVTVTRLTNAVTIGSLDCTGFTGTLIPSSVATTFDTGDVTLSSGMTLGTGGSAVWSYTATSPQTITSAGKLMPQTTVNGAGGGITLADNLSVGNSTLTLTRGTVDLNGKTLTCAGFSSSNANVRALLFNGGVLSGGAFNLAWTTNTITNLTIGSGGKISTAGGSATITSVSGVTIPAIEVVGSAAAPGGLTLDSASAIASLYVRTNALNTEAAVTFSQATTINGDLTLKKHTYDTAVANINVTSSSPGTARTVTVGGQVRLDGCTITDVTASGGTPWWARGGSSNGGGTTNISFSGGGDGPDYGMLGGGIIL